MDVDHRINPGKHKGRHAAMKIFFLGKRMEGRAVEQGITATKKKARRLSPAPCKERSSKTYRCARCHESSKKKGRKMRAL